MKLQLQGVCGKSWKEIKPILKKKYPDKKFDGFYQTDSDHIVNIYTEECPISEEQNCRDCKLKDYLGVCTNES